MNDSKVTINLSVNGQDTTVRVPSRTLLSELLRDTLGLTGTHVGCDTSQCGVCTVWMDGLAVKSCTILAAQADQSAVVTVEGLARGITLHPVQRAFQAEHGLQCGFCTPGAMMLAAWYIQHHHETSETAIREALDGLICRCTGYENIVRSVQRALAFQQEDETPVAAGREEEVSS